VREHGRRSLASRAGAILQSDGVGGYQVISIFLFVHVLTIGGAAGAAVSLLGGDVGTGLAFAAVGVCGAIFTGIFWWFVAVRWRDAD
jgi:hypothetical protein